MFLAFSNFTTNVKAVVSQANVEAAAKVMQKYDGISDWALQNNSPSNQIGEIPIGGGISLGYTFGSARNSSGKVVSGDTTITKVSGTGTVNSAPIINNGKINVFLNYNGSYYGILHQGENSYIGGTPETASNTSIDYALLTNNRDSYFYSDMNVLNKLDVIDSSSKTNRLFYVGHDLNKKPVYKLVGYYTPNHVYVEIVLRPSPTGSPIVQRELYVYNPGTSDVSFQTFYGEDTGLNNRNNDDSVDNVPMFAIGGGQGLYLLSGADYDPASKLFITNDVDGGFKDFMGRVLTNPTNWGIKGKQYSSAGDITDPKLPWASNPTASQNGDTNAAADSNLLVGKTNAGANYNIVDSNGKQDTAYTLRWPETKLGAGQVQKYVSKIGATIQHYAIPVVKKSYTNLTSTDGINRVGDKLAFKLSVKDDGYDSSWKITKVLDQLPTGLTIDPNSVNNSMVNGNSIDFSPNQTISSGGQTAVYTFNATINNQAPYNLTNGNLTNTASFTGTNQGTGTNHSESKTYSDSVDIPVQTPSFKYRFTKQVRNNTTNPNGAFSDKVTAQKGDTIEYKIDFTSNGNSSLTGANFADSLPSGLELDSNSVTLNNIKKDSLNFSTGALVNNYDNIISFKATVTGISTSTASNTAHLQNVTTSAGQSISNIDTEVPAVVEIEAAPITMAITKYPETIDFGSVNTSGVDRIIPNISTSGNLAVDHPDDTPFQVSVSYNNNGENALASNGTKLIQDNGESLLFNQTDDNNSNIWKPLSAEPTPIKSEGFSGSYTDFDLTKYIGSNKWKLRVPGSAKAGKYTGKITWSISDTM